MEQLFTKVAAWKMEQELKLNTLEKFSEVLVEDSTSWQLPAGLSTRFAGCGGGASKAGIKLNVRLDLKGSALPNPARDQVTLRFGDSTRWRLFSPAGQEVMRVEGQGPGGTLDVNLSNLLPGIYFYAFQTKNGQPLAWYRLAIVR